jgi:hypothetical protein
MCYLAFYFFFFFGDWPCGLEWIGLDWIGLEWSGVYWIGCCAVSYLAGAAAAAGWG